MANKSNTFKELNRKSTKRRIKSVNITEISMKAFISDEETSKDVYNVIFEPYLLGVLVPDGSTSSGGVGLSLAILPAGQVVVNSLNNISIFLPNCSIPIYQPSPAQIHGGISVGDYLIKVNKFSLETMDLMQINNILQRFDVFLQVLYYKYLFLLRVQLHIICILGFVGFTIQIWR